MPLVPTSKLIKSNSTSCCSSDHINSISGLVTSGQHSHKSKSSSDNQPTTRCPHVCLIGNFYTDDLLAENLLQIKQNLNETRRKQIHSKMIESLPNKEHEQDQVSQKAHNPCLKCDQCEQTKNLWLCLREDCYFIGCGGTSKDETSAKHSTWHAQVS
jgi:hypothetical protein